MFWLAWYTCLIQSQRPYIADPELLPYFRVIKRHPLTIALHFTLFQHSFDLSFI